MTENIVTWAEAIEKINTLFSERNVLEEKGTQHLIVRGSPLGCSICKASAYLRNENLHKPSLANALAEVIGQATFISAARVRLKKHLWETERDCLQRLREIRNNIGPAYGSLSEAIKFFEDIGAARGSGEKPRKPWEGLHYDPESWVEPEWPEGPEPEELS